VRGDQQPLQRRFAHRLGGIIHQVNDHALELLGIDVDRREMIAQLDTQIDVFQAAVEDLQRVFHDFIQIAGDGLRRGKARELREFVGQVFDGFRFARDGGRALSQDALGFGSDRAAIELARDPIRAQHDGRERIFQFVRDTPRDFVPRRGFLRAQKLAGVFQNDDEAGCSGMAARQSGNGDRQMQDLTRRFQIHLARGHAGAARAFHQVLNLGDVLGRKQIVQMRRAGDLVLGEQAAQGAIDALDPPVGRQ
jgi:hypothetical protein